MPLSEKKFLNNFRSGSFIPFKSYSNYNLARLVEGLKNGARAPMHIVNGKLLNNVSTRHVINKGNLLGIFGNYMNGIEGNNSAAARAFKSARINQYRTFAEFAKTHGNRKTTFYNSYNKPSKLTFAIVNAKPKTVTVTLMPNGIVRSYLEGNTWVEYKGKRYPYVKQNNIWAFNRVLRQPNAAPKPVPKPKAKPAKANKPKPKPKAKPAKANKPKPKAKPTGGFLGGKLKGL